MTQNLISVIIPCYNRAQLIIKSVDSVLNQTYKNIELIVVDDGSTDNSLQVLEAIREKDNRVKVISQENKGPYPARNKGLKEAKGEFIAFLDSDDTWDPHFLQKLYKALEAHPAAVLAYCGWQNTGLPGQRGKPFIPPDYEARPNKAGIFLKGNRWPIHAALTRRNILDEAGGFDEQFTTAMDYDLWLRIVPFHKIVLVPEVLAFYYFHKGAQIHKDKHETEANVRLVGEKFIKLHPEFRDLDKAGQDTGVKIPILMYHNIGEPAEEKDRPYFVSAGRLKKQMRFLQKAGYEIIDLPDLIEGFKDNKPLPLKPIIITFDDGTESIYKNAFPVLREYNFKTTVFLTINYLNKGAMQEKSFLKYTPLSWEQIREMQKRGVSFYPHSLTHPRLTKILPEKAFYEIRESKRILEEKLGRPMDFFSYPYGDFNEETEEMVKKCGYRGAVDAWGGINNRNTDVFGLKRIPVFERDDSLQLGLKLLFGLDKVTLGFLAGYYWRRIVARWISAS